MKFFASGWLVVVAAVCGGGALNAWAAVATNSSPAAGSFPTPQNPAFFGAQSQVGASSGALFSSCESLPVQLPGIAQAMAPAMATNSGLPRPSQCVGGGALQAMPIFTPQLQCNGSSEVRGRQLSCQDLPDPANIAQALAAEKRLLTEASCAAICKIGKSAAISSELNCLGKAMAALTAEIQNATLMMNQLYKKDQAETRVIKNQVDDLKSRQVQVKKALIGDPESGRPGLKQMADQVKKSYDGLTVQINQTKASIVQIDSTIQAVEQSQKLVKSARMMDCINNTTFPQFKCGQTGAAAKPRTTLEYMECRFEQNQRLSKGNIIDRSNFAKAKGVESGLELKSILDQIKQSAPTMTQFPSADPKGGAAFVSQGASVVTIDQIAGQYKNQLQQLKIGNVDLWSFFSRQLSTCQSRATKSIDIEAKTPGSPLHSLKQSVTLQDNQLKTMVQQQLNENNKIYQLATGVLNVPSTLNVSQCEQGGRSTAVNCLENIRGRMQVLLGGGPNARPFNIPIQGPMPLAAHNSQYQGLSCFHLTDCVQSLERMSTSLDVSVKQGETVKGNYVFGANQKMREFADSISAKISPYNTLLKQKLGELTRAVSGMGGLGGLGGSSSMGSDRKIEPGDFELDEDGLARPGKLLNYLSQQMGGLMDFSNGGSLNQAASSLGRVTQKETQNLNRLAQDMARLKTLEVECPRAEARHVMMDIETRFSEIQNANCTEAWHTDAAGCQSRMQDLISSIRALQPSGGVLPATSVSSLQDGIHRVCPESQSEINHRLQLNGQEPQSGMLQTLSAGAQGICNGGVSSLKTKVNYLHYLSDQGKPGAATRGF